MKITTILLSLILLSGTLSFAQTVRFETNVGNIDVELLPNAAPFTVQNFLSYVNKNAYNNSFFHRSVRNFVIQGGGFRLEGTSAREIPQDPPVRNEFRLSNTRGTIAMAKLGNDPNSATNQWFFNTSNNAAQLDAQNGGFTVFGRIANDEGLAVMDRIAALPIVNGSGLNPVFGEIPLQNYTSGSFLNENNLVLVKSIRVIDAAPMISNNGARSAGDFGSLTAAAPGSYVEIFGANLADSSRGWASTDFAGSKAPSSLDNVSVTIGGQPAFVSYVSPRQVNVQVPAGLAPGATPVVVTNAGRSSAPVNITIGEVAGGLLATPAFRMNTTQFAVALHADGSYVSNGYLIGDIPAAPAKRGETLLFYGIGFGPVDSGEVAGQIAGGAWRTRNNVEFRFGDVPARVDYAGLAPSYVGLYQFNVVVPEGAPAGDIPLRVLVNGAAIAQNLFLTVAAQ